MKDLVQKRLEQYGAKNPQEELNALKEITQEIVLYSLHRVSFFQEVCFIGGTNLRILHGLDRFSEDLDFSCIKSNNRFQLEPYLLAINNNMQAFGYNFSLDDKALKEKSVQGRFIKDDSIKKILSFQYSQDLRTKIKIKIEVDTNPPEGATNILKYADFPSDYPVLSHDLSTLMSGKIHALLSRPYVKGRDWYDFLWYLANKISPNYPFLKNALFQMGPHQKKKIKVDRSFIKKEISYKIQNIDWKDTAHDVRKFLTNERSESLTLWNADFFLMKLDKMT